MQNNKIKKDKANKNRKEFDCHVTLPPTNELHKTFELPIINKKTKKTVSVLEQVIYIELIYGVNLKIKASELNEWEKVKTNINQLTKEQSANFLTTFSEMASTTKGIFSRQNILDLIEKIRNPKKNNKIRQSGHYIDSKLQHSTAEKLLQVTQEKIENSSITIKAYGIKLTPSEDKVMNALYKCLHDKSENKNTESELFYAGNEKSLLVPYGNENKQEKARVLRIKPTDLYKEYLGKDEYSGKEIANIKNTLYNLSEKKFLIQYNRQREVQKGNKKTILTDRMEVFQSLITILSYIEGMTEKEVKKLDSGDSSIYEKKGELIVAFNPILTDQINSKYVEFPLDINKRTMIACGGASRVTESINDLRDYLLREISAGRYKCELNEDTLIKQLRLTDYLKARRKTRIEQRINQAIEVSKKLGIINNVTTATGSTGQLKYIFNLNPDFE